MKADEFDRKFDAGEDITEWLEVSQLRRPGQELKRVHLDFPTWMIEVVDREAKRQGVTRQSIIQSWLTEQLKHSESLGNY